MPNVQTSVLRTATALSNRLYRRSGGRLMGSVHGVPVLLLTVADRTTGVPHTTPVPFVQDGSRLVVTGSAGGSPDEPQWFTNLRHAHRAVVEVGKKRYDVIVSIVGPDEHEALWERVRTHSPFFAGDQSTVDRQVPMATLTRTW
ncbi:nitroreductase/quinone reductase family protein [Pengzhenrongella frigida]|uniref:Nitroreductase family deazaflavin-dependent oxidoreductase n=1 Tax=Pengzhenrongella frigida TaxID=1259133 RepID=A0A4Q5N0P2_9MICO|nr:nitroreductase/quinone reductase family protein [Cellulomonas sp. HLT2-17]RYV51638.1 nitroreductase family deazaflavin-dependent oxidoreductase [Cellulomonas sp. HLT2-17]